MCRTHDESAFHLFIRCHGVPYLWVLCKKAMKVRIAFVNQENPLSYRKVQDVQLTVLKEIQLLQCLSSVEFSSVASS
jgi:hypothetical protein